MITNISHDLKTPLTSIVGYADLLAGVEGLPPEAADYVSVITKKSARLNALIKDLFDLSKATTNDLPLRPEPLDLVRLLHQLLAEQADAIAAAPVTLVTDLPEHECPLENDGTKLYRVFANLLENALRYALDGSRIFLTLRPTVWEGVPVWRVTVKIPPANTSTSPSMKFSPVLFAATKTALPMAMASACRLPKASPSCAGAAST